MSDVRMARYVNLIAVVAPFTTGGTHSRAPVRQEKDTQ